MRTLELGARLVVLEGGDGAGKTSAIAYIRDYLEQQGEPVVCTREPGGTPMAESIRALLLESRSEPVAAPTELLLMFAARAQHIQECILPALHSGAWVLSDRFVDASYAYQGAGRALGAEPVQWLEQFVLGTLRPGRVFWLDVPPEQGLARARLRGGVDRLDQESLSFHQRVYHAYRQRCGVCPYTHRRIDASVEHSKVIMQLMEYMRSYWLEVQQNAGG